MTAVTLRVRARAADGRPMSIRCDRISRLRMHAVLAAPMRLVDQPSQTVTAVIETVE
jgi:hypothetical protein